jgi:probable phosphoglycerate mutase
VKLALLRHGVTDWNLEKRVQGQIDRPLSRLGRQQLAELALPPSLAAYRWYCSPLLRARQTAELLGLKDVLLEPALIEMNWGDWEGKILKPLRRKLGDSIRQVQSRLRPWLRQVAASERDSAAVVHKGIIRCIYALASGWDMRGESPVDFAWDAIHQFELTPDGELCDSYQAIPLVKI